MNYYNPQFIQVGSVKEPLVSVIQFDNFHHHIVVLDGCWAVVGNGRILARIFKSAAKMIKSLPDNPQDYSPYVNFLTEKKLRLVS